MNNPLVSVFIPVYNGEATIKATIESVLSQTYTNLELIVVDDCSKDNSRQIIDSFTDPRIKRIYKEKNDNICISSNIGLDLCSGKYLSSMGHDDLWTPDKLEKQVRFLEANPDYSACFTRIDVINECDEIVNDTYEDLANMSNLPVLSQCGWIFLLTVNGNQLAAPSSLFRREVFDKTGGYKTPLLMTQDYEMWLRALTVGNIHVIDEKLTKYRRFSDNKKNLSSINQGNYNRGLHETQYLVFNYIMNLDNELFREAFLSYLKNPDFSGNVAADCEKALVLLSLKNCLVYNRILELFDDEEHRAYLYNNCDFSLEKFYELGGNPALLDHTYMALAEQQMEIIKQLKDNLSKTGTI